MKKFVIFMLIMLLMLVTSAVYADEGKLPPIDDDPPVSGGFEIDPGPNPWDSGGSDEQEPPAIEPAPSDDTPSECPGKRYAGGNTPNIICYWHTH